MDSLPQEILDNILGRIPAQGSDRHNSELFDDNLNSNFDYSSFPMKMEPTIVYRPHRVFDLISRPRNIEGDFHLMQKLPNLESFNLKIPEFPFFIRPRREMRQSLIDILSSNRLPASMKHGKLAITPNMYGPNQKLPHMTKDGESNPLFIAYAERSTVSRL
ncbi:hypothetical protein BDP55DRAFT_632529 [Colletotrichum godetiae]|uniref:Uncharacterized protein n=1 Tax=Colletotrichum godetiae TaxID=1209918 RepID=A0AAJ0AM02_9PEZI|nr:uncharacterized protein BDP55DRAFT_632529 [Colletotrichum godetiae]KAK1674878.1 hypothetical protein BDP55DRAFT_632529 [Colletotrichum godetiae]